MGFTVKESTATIRGADEFAGLEAEVLLTVPLRFQFDLTKRLNATQDCPRCRGTGHQKPDKEKPDEPLKDCLTCDGDGTIADSDSVESAYAEFGEKVLRCWNVEDKGGAAVPASAEGLLSQPQKLATALFKGWSAGLTAPPLVASETRSSGDTPA